MKLHLTTLLLISACCFSQKHYEFDYLLKYELVYYTDSVETNNETGRIKEKTLHKFYLTNSKKNNYSAVLTELDSLNYNMIFKDENGLSANVKVLKSDFNSAEFISIDCTSVTRYQNRFKYKAKHYDFFKLKDTLLQGKTYSRFKFESIKPKKTKRKQLAAQFYIIDQTMSQHLPVLNFSTAYENGRHTGLYPTGFL